MYLYLQMGVPLPDRSQTYSSRRQPLTAEFQKALRDSFVPFGTFAFLARVLRSDHFLRLALQPFDTFTRGLAQSSSEIDDSDAADIKADLHALTHSSRTLLVVGGLALVAAFMVGRMYFRSR
jgi:hypothetical protein